MVSVSLVLLRDFASHENERDALQTVRLLGTALAAERPQPGVGAIDTLAEVTDRRPQLLARLDDHRWLPEGRLLRHGYVFEAVRTGGSVLIRAWPWAFGRTGTASFAWDGSTLWGHPGRHGWSGEASPPELDELPLGARPADESWRRLDIGDT